MQLDQGKRGFSFMKEGPLDMRMDQTSDLTAKKIVNTWPEKKLGKLFKEYGEEPKWRQAAKAIVKARGKKTIETTLELSTILQEAVSHKPRKKIHPATLIFQALRMCVNRELESVQEGLQKAIKYLSPNGRIGALSFHSLEDRIVKNVFRDASKPIKSLVDNRKTEYEPLLKLLTKKPIACSYKEAKSNPRARSAKIRFAQKLDKKGS